MRTIGISVSSLLCILAVAGSSFRSTPQPIEDAGFFPSGWMGDGEKAGLPRDSLPVQVDPRSEVQPHSLPYSQKWHYRPDPRGKGWAAVAWQYPEKNWGDRPGKDWSSRGFTQVTVWARGVADRSGRLPRVQFKAGGGTDPAKRYQASFEVVGDFVTLTEDWKQYTLELRGQNLAQVIAAFVFVVRAQEVSTEGCTFFLDDVEYR